MAWPRPQGCSADHHPQAEVTPEVWPNTSLSLDDVQSMINSALET
jgi:hypothetical protein